MCISTLTSSAREAEESGDWSVALERYESALAEAVAAGDNVQAARLQRRVGNVHFRRGDYDLALEAFQGSRATAEEDGLLYETASALNSLAVVEQFTGRVARAEELYAQAAEMATAAGDGRLAALVQQNLGMLANVRGDVERALDYYRSALAHFEEIGDEGAASRALHNIGMAHVDRGEWEDARRAFDRAGVLAERAHDVENLGNVELNRGEMYVRQGEFQHARDCANRAFEIFGRLESRQGMAEAHKLYGVLFRESEHLILARTHLDLVVAIARESGDVLLEAEAEHELAQVHLAEGRNRDALLSLNRAQQLFTQLEARRDLVDVDRRLGRLEETYLRVVRSWGESIESKDRYTAGHCERVARYAGLLAEEAGITGHDLVWFRMGAFLHDVGKTAVPAEILNKPGSLTSEEWAVMQSHTTAGHEIVAGLGFPWDIGPMVRHHHERWDGTGYPDGLRGDEIPLSARILCIADAYDALTTDRSYRPARTREEALRILEDDAGRMTDPTLFSAFKQVLAQEPASEHE